MENVNAMVVQVHSFDGVRVELVDMEGTFEVGNYLGGGAAGTVYEAEYTKSKENFALKILNPLGYKLVSPVILRRCTVIVKGENYEESAERSNQPLTKEHIWWVLNGSTKQYLVAYYSEKEKSLKELTLRHCTHIWGTDLGGENDTMEPVQHTTELTKKYSIPSVPPKFADFVRRRSRIFREITNMRKISNHTNVIRLGGVLEYVQESKCTIFLVMELANGGELFDRIKLDCGTREDTAKLFLRQLLDGVRHCHDQGVCHRDLKPENLLLTDSSEGTVLKIADFGFSARFAMATDNQANVDWSSPIKSPPKNDPANNSLYQQQTPNSKNEHLPTLTSVVGSPFYVAPEILQAKGYSGPKADVWSIGVILYAILAGNLPFGQELVSCKRFKQFCKWVNELLIKNSSLQLWEDSSIDYPQWLFPAKFSSAAKGLIVGMLHPDPQTRISVQEAQKHPWCCNPSCSIDSVSDSTGCLHVDTALLNVTSSSDCSTIRDFADMQLQENCLFELEEAENVEIATIMETNETSFDSMWPEISLESIVETTSVAPPSTYNHRGSPHNANSEPPLAPVNLILAHADILEGPILEGLENEAIPVHDKSNDFVPYQLSPPKSPVSSHQSGQNPPSFSDLVKRSTRFITSVPAFDVLQKLMCVIEGCRLNKSVTSIGLIGRVDLIWESYRIEVWGLDTNGPAMLALQLYKMPDQTPTSAPSATLTRRDSTAELFLVEFIRGQLEIFAFKRFYQWVRNEVKVLVKKDYALEDFQAGSPVTTRFS